MLFRSVSFYDNLPCDGNVHRCAMVATAVVVVGVILVSLEATPLNASKTCLPY